MNIKRVKEELKNTIQAYLTKDEYGNYKIPVNRQRPVILIGPPGIGKTAIMEQVAREAGINLVAYTITHHTRQSAIGLPFIEKKMYDGKEYSVTEYTMSEIIGTVYDKIESTGIKEGILFIDEINCVSETLAPTMLQFLQGKTFGSHKVPEGFVIVAAGNPPEYNKSVKEFDIVTLDRVKKIEVAEDFAVWKEYAYKQGIHPAILSYLEIKKENFYSIETTVDGKSFVTARGWEDLSEILYLYGELGIEADEELIIQYVQHKKIAKDFANYLDLFMKYESDYKVDEILEGVFPEELTERLCDAPFDEKLSVIGLLLGKLGTTFKDVYETDAFVTELFGVLKRLKGTMANPNYSAMEAIQDTIEETKAFVERQKAADLLEKAQEKNWMRVFDTMDGYDRMVRAEGIKDSDAAFAKIQAEFLKEVEARKSAIETASMQLENAFSFMEQAFSVGTEMVIFMTELTTGFYSMKFISENGSASYAKYNKLLLTTETRRDILRKIEEIPEE
ncbi:MAG: AAA family ATPase [Lachnospiraceae bacterium]|nr:AAA family ATPase [Lachnospiraceae bacterium]